MIMYICIVIIIMFEKISKVLILVLIFSSFFSPFYFIYTFFIYRLKSFSKDRSIH